MPRPAAASNLKLILELHGTAVSSQASWAAFSRSCRILVADLVSDTRDELAPLDGEGVGRTTQMPDLEWREHLLNSDVAQLDCTMSILLHITSLCPAHICAESPN